MLKIKNLQAVFGGKPVPKPLRAGVGLAVAALIAGCTTPAGSPAHDDASAWRAEAASPARAYQFPAQVFAELYENFTGGEEGAPVLSIELSELGEDVIAISTQTGMLDDSVEAVQQRVVLERRADGLWWVRERGSRFRCYRGGRAGRWTTELCP
ncbi:MAG: hypothetical protein LC642_08240 [Verrucomicrobiaceae bacterium]|nr:hypothetical protein [Verrucomicrobiaceae bacterium]